MSPLWEKQKQKKRKLKMIHKRPSPRHRSDKRKYAQNRFVYSFLQSSIKGMSLFISRFCEASMTVEAAVVLPLFLIFFLALGSAMEMIRLHNNLEFALCDIGNRMSVYGYALTVPAKEEEQKEENGWLSEIRDVAFSYAYVKKEIKDYLGEPYLEASPIVNGASGLDFWESEIWDGGEHFEILVTYKVAPFGKMAGVKGFRMANRYYGHLWNGYQIPTGVVYITENGVVYHEDEMCTHLFLSVRQVSLQEAYKSRNSKGEKYSPCEYCERIDVKEWVYITENGNRIHYKRDCTGLKRTIYEVSRDEVKEYTPCNRCVKKQ